MIRYQHLKSLAKGDLTFVEARDGLLTLRVKDRFIHSHYSPGTEALRLVEGLKGLDPQKTFIVVFGTGIGYHIELLEREGFTRGVIIEKHPFLAKVFQEIYELPSTMYYIGPEQTEEALDSIFALLDLSTFSSVKTIILRGSYELSDYRPFEQRLQRLMQVKLGDFSTRLRFEEIWLIHMIRNIKNLPYSTPINRLFFRQSGLPVVIVSAGPSLRHSLLTLRKIASSALVVAVDTALLPLYEVGIIPDMVYSLDAQVHTLEDFIGMDRRYLSRIHLVYDMVAHPETLSFMRKANPAMTHYVSTTAHVDIDPKGNPFLLKNEFIQWLEVQINTRLGDVETGGSVSTSVFHAAFLMGGNPLILVGQDLAFSYQTTHVASTSHYYRYLPHSNRFKPVNTIFWEALLSRRLQQQEGIRSPEVYSDFVLSNFKGWFEVSAKRLWEFQRIRCINATEEGVRLEGFMHQDLEEVFHTLELSGFSKEKMFFSEPLSRESIEKTTKQLFVLQRHLEELPSDRSFFDKIREINIDFVHRYYLREKMLFDRYENVDSVSIERKTYRLVKAIEELSYE